MLGCFAYLPQYVAGVGSALPPAPGALLKLVLWLRGFVLRLTALMRSCWLPAQCRGVVESRLLTVNNLLKHSHWHQPVQGVPGCDCQSLTSRCCATSDHGCQFMYWRKTPHINAEIIQTAITGLSCIIYLTDQLLLVNHLCSFVDPMTFNHSMTHS